MKNRRVIIEQPRKGGQALETLEAERDYWKERAATVEHERDQYREALAAFLDEAALLHFIAELKRNTGIMDPERGGILNYLRQTADEPTPAFLITTEDTLSEADAEQLRADVQITARPAPDATALPSAHRCGRCRRQFGLPGVTEYQVTGFCWDCIDNCHEGGADHRCQICKQLEA